MQWCEAVVDLCDDEMVVVPGRGVAASVAAGVEGIKDRVKYFETVREAAGAALDAGKSREEFSEGGIDVLADYGSERIRMCTLGSVYDEVVRERSGWLA